MRNINKKVQWSQNQQLKTRDVKLAPLYTATQRRYDIDPLLPKIELKEDTWEAVIADRAKQQKTEIAPLECRAPSAFAMSLRKEKDKAAAQKEYSQRPKRPKSLIDSTRERRSIRERENAFMKRPEIGARKVEDTKDMFASAPDDAPPGAEEMTATRSRQHSPSSTPRLGFLKDAFVDHITGKSLEKDKNQSEIYENDTEDEKIKSDRKSESDKNEPLLDSSRRKNLINLIPK